MYQNHAFIGSEALDHGMQVSFEVVMYIFGLRQLDRRFLI